VLGLRSKIPLTNLKRSIRFVALGQMAAPAWVLSQAAEETLPFAHGADNVSVTRAIDTVLSRRQSLHVTNRRREDGRLFPTQSKHHHRSAPPEERKQEIDQTVDRDDYERIKK